MRVTHVVQGIHFEWDSEKAASNLRKHNVTFEKAREVFFDPLLQITDVVEHTSETREAVMGMTSDWKVLLVVYTLREDDVIRIISARQTTNYERDCYENN